MWQWREPAESSAGSILGSMPCNIFINNLGKVMSGEMKNFTDNTN